MFHNVGWALPIAASQARRLSVGWALPTAHHGDECAASRSTGLAPVAGTIDRLKRRRGADGFSAGLVPVESTIVPARRTSAAVQSFARPGQARHGARHVRRATVSLPITARRGQAPDVAGRSRCREDGGQCPPYAQPRRGVILLVVMALLSLLTLMGLTLVLVTAQGRLSALASARNGLQGEHDTEELTYARIQVISGSADPNSSFGAHGLIEDLYGASQFFGQIMPNTGTASVVPLGETATGATFLAGRNNGALLQLLIMAGNRDPSTGTATGPFGAQPQSANQYILPTNSGAFCGQVITMLTGPAAGQSARVVGYYYNPVAAGFSATMQVSSFGGVMPQPGDQFMINGRPFAGTGFGLDLTKFYMQPGATVIGPWVAPYTQAMYSGTTGPLLGAFESVSNAAGMPPSFMPYSYLPNHSRIGLTGYAPLANGTYWDVAGPGGANESYDAPDLQNMMLAMHYWNSASGSVLTPIPSMHRPELVGWYFYQSYVLNAAGFYSSPALGNPNDGAGGQNMLTLRRKVILRPEPSDHYFVDTNGNNVWDAREPFWDKLGNYASTPPNTLPVGAQYLDLNGNGKWDAGEVDYSGHTFNPVTGCWYITATGSWAVDVNGGTTGLDVDNDNDGTRDSIWVDGGLPVHTEADGTLTKNLIAVLCIDLDGKVNLNATGTLAQLDAFRYPYNMYLNTATPPVNNDQGIPPNPWLTLGLSPALDSKGVALQPNTLTAPLNATGSTTAYVPYPVGATPPTVDYNQRTLPVGQGHGPADINPVHIFLRSHGPAKALTYYQTFLQGFNSYPTAPGAVASVDGKYGESARLTLAGVTGFNYPGVFPLGSVLPTPWSAGVSPITWTQFYTNGPRAGWSQWFDPYNTSLLGGAGYWVNDPVALARFSDFRPGLLTPPAVGSAYPVPYFFDYFTSTVTPSGSATGPGTHMPTSHGTPSDLHSRGFLATDLTGRPYYAGTATFPWLAAPATWSATMWDFPISEYTTPWPFLAEEYLLNEGVDTAYEVNQGRDARQYGQNTGNSLNNIPDFASVDSKLNPSELEAILRFPEVGSGSTADPSPFLTRLNNLETAANYVATGGKDSLTTALGNDKVRLNVTSESSDIPMPSLALTPRQMQDVVQFADLPGASGSSLGNPNMLNLSNISLVELARARVYADNYNPATGMMVGNIINNTASIADTALFGNLKNIQQYAPGVTAFPLNPLATPPLYPVWPLLAPETVLGLRLDVNRLLGNGYDDNGNGVVDEPAEALWQKSVTIAGSTFNVGETLNYPFSQVNPGSLLPTGQVNTGVTNQNNMLGVLDLNNDGFYPIGTGGTTSIDPQLTLQNAGQAIYLPQDPTGADMRARQLLARHLYCLVMLLLDDRPIVPSATDPTQMIRAQIFNLVGPSAANYMFGGNLTGTPNYQLLATMPREQAAYVIAQWAVNVVDFRDRDSIMTPFEFDLYPFRADDPTQPNITWNVDDIIDPYYIASGAMLLPGSRSDDAQPWRGLVFGCERPELLLTETVAFHDRGTADTSNAQQIDDNINYPMNPTGKDTATTAPAMPGVPNDNDYDQVRRPRGSLVVELFNPTNYWDPPQYDMQTYGIGPLQPWQSPDGNGNIGTGVNLCQVATGQPTNNDPKTVALAPLSSPVWRLVVAYSPWQALESACYGTAPAGTVPPVGGGGYAASPTSAGTTQIDPRAPVLPPGVIHRAVYFTPFQIGFVSGKTLTPNAAVADTLLNNSFFADPDIFDGLIGVTEGAPALLLPPGQYALVGPAAQDPNALGNYFVYAGRNTTVTNTNMNSWKLQLASLGAVAPVPRSAAWLYNAAGLQGPYGPAPGYTYTGVNSTSTSMKGVVGVPIQTNWFQSNGGLPQYVQHNFAGAAGVSAAAPPAISTTLRMSVSEPEHGYPVWQGAIAQVASGTGAASLTLADDATYYSAPGTPAAGYGPFPQHPFDSAQGQPVGKGPNYTPYLQFGDLPNPYVAPSGTSTQDTTLGYTVLYLQRLANPLQAWDQKMNPYVTVDSMPIDLTAYTGEWASPEVGTYYQASGGINPTDTKNTTWTASPGPNKTSFDTRRRGYDTATTTVLQDQKAPNIWTPLPISKTLTYQTAGQYSNSNAAIQGTIMNPMPVSVTPVSAAGDPKLLPQGSSLGWLNYEYSGGSFYVGNTVPGPSGAPAYNGDPMVPFPWLTWNNRPYISQFELMLVPASSPSSLARDFGMLGWQSSGASAIQPSEYLPGMPGKTTPPQPQAGMLPVAQFAHLLNFFNAYQVGVSVTGTAGTYPPGASVMLPNLYRVFEFLQVPSHYTGTQELLNPSQFAGDDAVSTVFGIGTNVVNSPATHLFHTPFNWLPTYREPGKINLNTIFDPVVFKSLMDDYPGTLFNTNGIGDPTAFMPSASTNSLWQYFFLSRQGFNTGAATLPSFLPPNPVVQFSSAAGQYPTYFANPFRPDGASAFSPPTAWSQVTPPVAPPLLTASQPLMQQWSYPGAGTVFNGVNTTMLRPTDPTNPNFTSQGLALFDDTSFDTTNLIATYKTTVNYPFRDAGQNPTFQYQMFNRLGNTTTNRSNVYAIWITLGKFQVQAVAPSPTNPDGYKLVQPYLNEQGQQVQTRGFYVFDRSIPMGFQRGQDINIEKGLLIERVLESP